MLTGVHAVTLVLQGIQLENGRRLSLVLASATAEVLKFVVDICVKCNTYSSVSGSRGEGGLFLVKTGSNLKKMKF